MPRIYLDHAATTPILPQARAAMAAALETWGETWANPSSVHAGGRAARAALENARDRIKAALRWKHELIFTSGASEAIGLAFDRQDRSRPVLVGATEHLSVLYQCPPTAPLIGVGSDGLIDPAELGALARANPDALFVVQHVNSETGIIQPIASMIEVIDAIGGVMLVDCAQSAGKLPLPPADLLVVSAHKLGGPPGIGALLIRDPSLLRPFGRGQEQGYRLGTENLPAILGFAAALDGLVPDGDIQPWVEDQMRWRVLLDNAVQQLGGDPIGGHALIGAPRIPTIGSYRFPGISAASILVRLDLAGISVSAGSACSSGSMQPSHVLAAMGVDRQAAGEVFRVSFGQTTSWEDVDRLVDALAAIVGRRIGSA